MVLSEQPMKAARSFIPMTEVCPFSPEGEGELGEEELAYRARKEKAEAEAKEAEAKEQEKAEKEKAKAEKEKAQKRKKTSNAIGKVATTAANTIGREAGKSLYRGVLGILKKIL